MAGPLAGQNIVIVGASLGLGGAIAELFAAQGASLLLVARQAERLQASATSLAQSATGQIHAFAHDMTEPQAGAQLLSAVQRTLGGCDHLVIAAGHYVYKPFVALSEAEWDASLGTNLKAPFLLGQAFFKYWQAHAQRGSILLIGSVHGFVGDANAAAQCASKAGLRGLCSAMAEAGSSLGVRVNAIHPGAMAAQPAPAGAAPHSRLLTPEEVAHMALSLTLPQAAQISGAQLEIFGKTRPVLHF